MNKNAARELRRDILECLHAALRVMGEGAISGSDAMEAYATAHRMLGRLQAVDELEAYEDACECGRRAKFPAASIVRPAVEMIDPDLPPQLVEAALYAAREVVADELMGLDLDIDGDSLDAIEAELRKVMIPPGDIRGMASRY